MSGSLQQINFPTGGTTQFTYEPNSYNFLGTNFLGAGIRIQKTVTYDGVSHANDIIRTYKYQQETDTTKSSGVLIDQPIFGYVNNGQPVNYLDSTGIGHGADAIAADQNSFDYYNYFVTRLSNPSYTLSSLDGPMQVYRTVTETETGRGKMVSTFSTPGSWDETNDNPAYGCSLAKDGICNSLFTLPGITTFPKPARSTTYFLTGMNLGQNGYPFAPRLNYGWVRGLLLQEKKYTGQNQLIQQTINTYSLFAPNGPKYVTGIRDGEMQVRILPPIPNDIVGLNIFGFVDHFLSNYKIIVDVDELLSSSIVQDYDLSKSGAYTLSSTYYSYDAKTGLNDKQVKQVKIVRSGATGLSADTLLTEYHHTLDYISPDTSSLQPGLNALRLKNMTTAVLRKDDLLKRNSSLYTRASQFTTYKSPLANLVVKDKVYAIENTGILAGRVSDNYNSTTNFTLNNQYIPRFSYDLYDNLGNETQVSQTGGTSSVFLWGHSSTLPICQVKNAPLSQVAYTSFENGLDDGNWIFDHNFVAYDAPTTLNGQRVKTGVCLYILQTTNTAITTRVVPAGQYIVSYWATAPLTVNGASPTSTVNGPVGSPLKQYIHLLNSPGSWTPTIQGNAFLDELRLYPVGAQMTTYTYTPEVGISSITDAKGQSMYYNYDALQRLQSVMDNNHQIMKDYKYNYGH